MVWKSVQWQLRWYTRTDWWLWRGKYAILSTMRTQIPKRLSWKYCNLRVEQILFSKRRPSYLDFFLRLFKFLSSFTAVVVPLPSPMAWNSLQSLQHTYNGNWHILRAIRWSVLKVPWRLVPVYYLVIHTVQQGTWRLRVSLLEIRNFNDGSDCASSRDVFIFSSSSILIPSFL